MLNQFRVHPTLPAQDLDRARDYYVDALGMEPATENPNAIFFDCADGTRFLVFKSSGKPSGDHTQLGFTVTNIEDVVAELRQRGVEFEGEIGDMGGLKNAFFHDSEGNLIGLVEFVGAGA
jgi:catechol 2,3-dioxygenase-like lactoylglutathione lyase family enzyme